MRYLRGLMKNKTMMMDINSIERVEYDERVYGITVKCISGDKFTYSLLKAYYRDIPLKDIGYDEIREFRDLIDGDSLINFPHMFTATLIEMETADYYSKLINETDIYHHYCNYVDMADVVMHLLRYKNLSFSPMNKVYAKKVESETAAGHVEKIDDFEIYTHVLFSKEDEIVDLASVDDIAIRVVLSNNENIKDQFVLGGYVGDIPVLISKPVVRLGRYSIRSLGTECEGYLFDTWAEALDYLTVIQEYKIKWGIK